MLDPNFKQPYTYTSREYDEETGLYYYRARYYDSTIGRFISEDPIRLAGGINLYTYVHNQPTVYKDPLGLLAFHWHYLITTSATLPLGPALSSILALKVVWVDTGLQGIDAASVNRHAMAGEGQSCKDAIQGTKNFIQDSIKNHNYADAIHAAQDLATPLHAGQKWTGTIDSEHLIGDVFPTPATIWHAYVNTFKALFSGF